MSKWDDYCQALAAKQLQLIQQQQQSNTSTTTGQPFIGVKVLNPQTGEYQIQDASGNVYNNRTIGSPSTYDASIVLNNTDAAQVNEPYKISDDDQTSGGFVAFQYQNHNYIRKIGNVIDPVAQQVQISNIIAALDLSFAASAETQGNLLSDLSNQPHLPSDANNFVNPPLSYYPLWTAYTESMFLSEGSTALNFIPYPFPEYMLDPRIKPDDYIVLFTSDGKNVMFGGAYCNRMPDENFPEADGHCYVEFVIYRNFKLNYDSTNPNALPTIVSSDWNPGDTIRTDGTPVVQKYDLNLAFDGFSKPPVQYDQSGPGLDDPRLQTIYMYVPGSLTPDTGSQFFPSVNGSYQFSGSQTQPPPLEISELNTNLTGTWEAVYRGDPETLLQINQVAWAFNNDSKGVAHLDVCATAINTCVYYLYSNDVDQNIYVETVLNNANGGPGITGDAYCNYRSSQHAIFDWYSYPHDWVGNYQSIGLSQYQIGLIQPEPTWDPPQLGTGYPFTYNGITWVNAGESPVDPLPDINMGQFGGVPYIHSDGGGDATRSDGFDPPTEVTGFDGSGDFGPTFDPSYGNNVGGLVEFDGVPGSSWCVGLSNGGGDTGAAVLDSVGTITGTGTYSYFNGSPQTFTDVPSYSSFCTDPCFTCETTNFYTCYTFLNFFPTYLYGSTYLMTYETNLCSVQDIQLTGVDQATGSGTPGVDPDRVLQGFPNVGQGDQRTIVRMFRSVAGNPALMYTFSHGIQLGGDLANADASDSSDGGLDLLDSVLDNLDALAAGQYVPGLSGTLGTGTAVDSPGGAPIYWEATVPYGTAPQKLLPDGVTAPDGFVITDQWYFPHGTWPYPYQIIKATDTSYFQVYVTGYYEVDGVQQTDTNGDPITYEFIYEYSITRDGSGNATIGPTGKSIQGTISSLLQLTNTIAVGGSSTTGDDDGDPTDAQILSGFGDVGSVSGGGTALTDEQLVGSANPPGDGNYIIQDYILLGGGSGIQTMNA